VVVGVHVGSGECRDHLVGVHVRRGARTGLEHVDGELGVVLAGGDGVGGSSDALGDVGIEQTEFGVHPGRRGLDAPEPSGHLGRDRFAGHREVVNRLAGLGTPQFVRLGHEVNLASTADPPLSPHPARWAHPDPVASTQPAPPAERPGAGGSVGYRLGVVDDISADNRGDADVADGTEPADEPPIPSTGRRIRSILVRITITLAALAFSAFLLSTVSTSSTGPPSGPRSAD
jgi:hypothetical protein